jgi:phosphoribosylanthranilate isomerase
MSTVEIKICGITRVEDALAADELGAAMIGLNFYAGSPRCITVEQAKEIAAAVAVRVKLIGVFVNMNVSDLLRIAHAVPLDAVQLHGNESLADCETIAKEFKVIRTLKVDAGFNADVSSEFSVCSGLLLDTPSAGHGGSGESFNWSSVSWKTLRRACPSVKVFLAGGLHKGNIAAALADVHPDVVDVCSSVESAKGIKSLNQMREFVAAVHAAERQEH